MPDVDISVGADTSAAAAGMAELRNYAQKARTDIQREFSSAISFTSLTGGLAAVTAAISGAVERMHEIHHESERFGIDAQQLQLIANPAQLVGLSMEQVARGMNLVEIAGAKALNPMSAQAAALQQLDIDATYFNSLNPAEKLLAVADAWNAGAKGGEDYAAVAKLIGARFGTELIPMLNMGSDAIKETAASMGVLSNATVEKGEIIHQFWERLKNMMTVVTGTVIGEVFREVADFFLLWRTEAQITSDVVGGAMQAIGKSLILDFSGAKDAMQKGLADAREHYDQFWSTGKKVAEGGLFAEPKAGAPGEESSTGTGGAADITDVSASALAGGGGGSGRGGGATKEASLRASIAKLEEAHIGRQLSDQEQLGALNAKGTELYYAQAAAAGDVNKELAAREAYLKNQAEIDKLTDQIDKDKLDTAAKITKEREKEEQQAQQNLADARESNKEFGFELAGRKDLAERAKIEYDYDQKIATAKADKAAAEAQGFTGVAATNQALIDQLGLEKANAIAAHDKAEAEKRAAAVVQAKAQLEGAQKSSDSVKEQAKEFDLVLAGRSDLAALAKTEYDFNQKIADTAGQANDLWWQSAEAYRQNNVQAGDLLAKAALLKDSDTADLAVLKQKTITRQAEAAAGIVHGIGASADTTRQLNPGESVVGYDQFGRPVTKGGGGPGSSDLTIGALAQGNLRMGTTSMGMALLAAGGDMNSAAYQKAFAHYSALDQLERLTGKSTYSFIDRAAAGHALDVWGQKQDAIAKAQSDKSVQDETAYWQAIARGQPPPAGNPFTAMYSPQQPGAATGTPSLSALAQFTQQQHMSALQRLNPLSSGNAQVAQLQNQVSLLQKAVTRLDSIDKKLTPQIGSH